MGSSQHKPLQLVPEENSHIFNTILASKKRCDLPPVNLMLGIVPTFVPMSSVNLFHRSADLDEGLRLSSKPRESKGHKKSEPARSTRRLAATPNRSQPAIIWSVWTWLPSHLLPNIIRSIMCFLWPVFLPLETRLSLNLLITTSILCKKGLL